MKFLFLAPLLALVFLFQAQPDPEKIFWKEEPLTWDDFRALPAKGSPFKANTNAGLSYSWSIKEANGVIELQYEVQSFFSPKRSWVVPDSKSEHLLKHEQLHFDITELHARKLRKQLASVSPENLGKDPRKVLNNYYKKIDEERAVMQQKFDKESNHSMNKEAEARWQVFVKEELGKLKEFAS